MKATKLFGLLMVICLSLVGLRASAQAPTCKVDTLTAVQNADGTDTIKYSYEWNIFTGQTVYLRPEAYFYFYDANNNLLNTSYRRSVLFGHNPVTGPSSDSAKVTEILGRVGLAVNAFTAFPKGTNWHTARYYYHVDASVKDAIGTILADSYLDYPNYPANHNDYFVVTNPL